MSETTPERIDPSAALTPEHAPRSMVRQTPVVYTAEDDHQNSLKTLFRAVKNIIERRELLRILIGRDLASMHKKSFLGLAWTVITPALSIASFVLLRLTGVLKTGQTLSGAQYIVYILAGTTIFNMMRAISGQVSKSFTANTGLLLQIKFPRELMIVKHLALAMVTSTVGIIVTMLVALAFGFVPTLNWLLFFPSLLPLILVGLSVGIIMSLAAVVAMDIDRLVDILWGFLFVAVPVIYLRDDTLDPPFSDLLFWNPFTHLIEVPRFLMVGSGIYDVSAYFIVSGITVLLFLFAWHLFSRAEARLMERLV